jgi:hypothetical protein
MRNEAAFEFNPDLHGEGLTSENPAPKGAHKRFFSLPDGRTFQYAGLTNLSDPRHAIIPQAQFVACEVFHDDDGYLRYLTVADFKGTNAMDYLGILVLDQGAMFLTLQLQKDGFIQPLTPPLQKLIQLEGL